MPFSLPELLLPFAAGAALGYFGGVFGIGGGIIAIPLLVMVSGVDQAVAQGTALVMMVPNLVVACWRYQRRHPVGWPAMLAIALPASLTTWLLARVANGIDSRLLGDLFCAFLALLAVQMLLRRPGRRATNRTDIDYPLPVRRLPWVGMAGGISMGLLGIGGGLVATPLLAGWLRQRQTLAQSLALALVAPSSIVALAGYAAAGNVDWSVGLPLAAGGMLTVSAGVGLAHRLPERRLRIAFATMLLISVGWLASGLR